MKARKLRQWLMGAGIVAAIFEPSIGDGQTSPTATVATTPTDAQRTAGQQLATQGATGVAACSGCHGAKGEGNVAANFPRLAGQSFVYLSYQLQSYSSDLRQNPVMSPIAKAMTPEQRLAGAAWYASLANDPAVATAAPRASAAGASAAAAARQLSRGQRLAEVGDESRKVQACANCHGAGGIGEGSAAPYLAGQHAGVLQAFLASWRDGSRHNDPSGQMPVIAKSLDDADIAAVSAFYADRAPPPTPRDTGMALSASNGRTVVSGPRGGGDQSTRGVGSEQGAPLTGGSQGIGGGGGGSGAGPTGSGTGAADGGNGPKPGTPASQSR